MQRVESIAEAHFGYAQLFDIAQLTGDWCVAQLPNAAGMPVYATSWGCGTQLQLRLSVGCCRPRFYQHMESLLGDTLTIYVFQVHM